MGKKSEQTFFKDIQMTNEHKEKILNIIAIREMQIKP